jgi:hypothetical protein
MQTRTSAGLVHVLIMTDQVFPVELIELAFSPAMKSLNHLQGSDRNCRSVAAEAWRQLYC